MLYGSPVLFLLGNICYEKALLVISLDTVHMSKYFHSELCLCPRNECKPNIHSPFSSVLQSNATTTAFGH